MRNIDTSDAHAAAVGAFYIAAHRYGAKYKIGGLQKLQRLIGADLLYKVGKDWWWNNSVIIRMTIEELDTLTQKIR